MSVCGPYVPVIKAEFGRTITEDQINHEFQVIESILQCLCETMEGTTENFTNYYDNGSVTSTTILQSNAGLIQYLTVEGDVTITIADPQEGDPRLITLVIADGGNGRFNFSEGAAWASDVSAPEMDGYPWNPMGLGGDYGALVTCLYDGEGWIFLVYGRHDIDYTATAEVEDIYNWR